MIRFLSAVCVLMLLAGCGGGNKVSPSNLDNACSIVKQRPKYLRAMKKTEKKWGVPVPVQMAVMHQESKFDGDARTPLQWQLGVIPMGRQSSAFGYSQALDGTWDHYRTSTGNRGAKRDKIRDATDFMGWYMNETKRRNGIPLSDARRQYLAYHEGWTGYARGSYRAKGWLVSVSSRVGDRAVMYDRQLRSCGKR
ncbi:hypothetical protein CLV78_11156 [Aliiruegeria haliotis]|uniref:Transglycosylase SLT domain-containing protein n=1 Tax=Aliiruegeria haliotis TaxID=1280846 RepID=A0A2T0RIF6_9RHOB|nr:lytic transglycosylase [Aliiruegeria haliotis]PRY20902.1 hypothetical protein CLV78_11156 [Aliiruegeria haliotis]